MPVHDDRKHFEFLLLDAFQAGLSWAVILNKREGFRRAFAGCDPARVARLTARSVPRLLADPGIVRNRQKIEATIRNARAFLAVFPFVAFFGAAFQPLRAVPGSSAFARRYLRSRGCFPFLQLLRCFSSLRSLPDPMHSGQDALAGGLPHSEIPRSQLGYQLPWAYRRFPRLSSPLDA